MWSNYEYIILKRNIAQVLGISPLQYTYLTNSKLFVVCSLAIAHVILLECEKFSNTDIACLNIAKQQYWNIAQPYVNINTMHSIPKMYMTK